MKFCTRLVCGLMCLTSLTHCGFRPVNTSLSYPFKSLHIVCTNDLWCQRVNDFIQKNDIQLNSKSPLQLKFTDLQFSASSASLNEASTTTSLTYYGKITATIVKYNKVVASRTFSSSTVVYNVNNQVFMPPANENTKKELTDQLFQQFPFWLASSDLKKAIKGQHAN